MAAKKKKKLTAKQLAKRRSAAAKRGWVTRRQKQNLVQEVKKKSAQINNAKKAAGKKPKRTHTKGKTVKELKEIIKKKDEQIELILSTREWVNALPDEFLKKDGTIALEPTMLRHLGKLTDEILKVLKSAKKKGEQFFNQMVNLVADQLQVPVREVYTLWYSP